MNTSIAFHLLEKGEACCLYASVLIVKTDGKYYISFDGVQWEETDCDLVKEQI